MLQGMCVSISPVRIGFGSNFLPDVGKEVVCKNADWWQVEHAFVDLGVHPSNIICQLPEIVFYDDFFGDDVKSEVYVFWVPQGCVEVEVCDIHGVISCAQGGDSGVEKEFRGDEISCWCCFVAGVLDPIATASKACIFSLVLVISN